MQKILISHACNYPIVTKFWWNCFVGHTCINDILHPNLKPAEFLLKLIFQLVICQVSVTQKQFCKSWPPNPNLWQFQFYNPPPWPQSLVSCKGNFYFEKLQTVSTKDRRLKKNTGKEYKEALPHLLKTWMKWRVTRSHASQLSNKQISSCNKFLDE